MNKGLLIGLPVLLLLGGGVVGAAFLGVIDIPGITPHHKKHKASPVTQVAAKTPPPTPVEKKPTPPPPAPVAVVAKKPDTVMDKVAGAKKLADLWNEVDSKKLADVIKDWKDPDVARVFSQMDSDKVAEVLSQMDAKRASKISIAVEKEASLVVKTDS